MVSNDFFKSMKAVKNQIGFKEKSRTADHIFTLKTIIDQYKQESFYCFHRLKKVI
jgi:hypothetical protein